jgi:hypothetical protein
MRAIRRCDNAPVLPGVRRRTSFVAVIASLALLVLLVAFVAADASGSRILPASPTFLRATPARGGLQIDPPSITYTGDGTGFLGGPNVRDRSSGIGWTRWTAEVALGSGFNQLNNCTPSCAGGTFRGYPVKIELWRPRTLSGALVFTRMTIFYKKSHPPGEQSHYTFTDTYTRGTDGGYGWGPPSDQSYCTNTYGQPPEASCKNIHTLP